MKTEGRKSTLVGRGFLLMIFVSGLLVAAIGWGNSAQATGTSSPRQYSEQHLPASCQNWPHRHAFQIPKGLVPKGQPILAGPIVVGCGNRLGEPVAFTAYVQATLHGGEQLCYVLEQPGQKAATGGSCFQTAPSLPLCKEGCPFDVEATVAKWGDQASKGSLVTGAAPGVIEEVRLFTSPLGNKKVSPPFIVVLEGAVQKELRLPSVVSLFASVVIPCLPARQVVYAEGDLSGGEEFSMQGSDPFSCHE